MFLTVFVSFPEDRGRKRGRRRTMGTDGVSPQALLWLSLSGLSSLVSPLNPDDPNVCSHWERYVSPVESIQYSKWYLTKEILPWTNGLPATNQSWGFANNQMQKGKGLLLGTYRGCKFKEMVMWLLEWSQHSAVCWVKAQCRFWWELGKVQVLWSIMSLCNQ